MANISRCCVMVIIDGPFLLLQESSPLIACLVHLFVIKGLFLLSFPFSKDLKIGLHIQCVKLNLNLICEKFFEFWALKESTDNSNELNTKWQSPFHLKLGLILIPGFQTLG